MAGLLIAACVNILGSIIAFSIVLGASLYSTPRS